MPNLEMLAEGAEIAETAIADGARLVAKLAENIGIADRVPIMASTADAIVPHLQIAGKLDELGNLDGVAKLLDEGPAAMSQKEFDAKWASGDYMGLDVKVKPLQPDSTQGWLISDKFLKGRQEGATGKVVGYAAGHGDVFAVTHTDGTQTFYRPDELGPAVLKPGPA